MKYDMTIEEIRDGYRDLFFKSGCREIGFFMLYRSLEKLASDVYNAEVVETYEDEEGLTI